ncbi:MAG TPA: exo-alpha-sialidase [Chloroflexota bacterium]
MEPKLRARISGATDLALNYETQSAAERLGRQVSVAAAGAAIAAANSPTNFFPHNDGCPERRGSNTKINQNCLNLSDADLQGRAQAQNETSIASDPNDQQHVVASFNDYRRGDGTCGTSYSLDGGRSWNDSTTPNGFTRGNAGNIQGGTFGKPREYWQASGDTSVAWDSRGNAYLSCQLFNRGSAVSPNPDLSSGFVVFRSTQNDGASWNFPGRYVIVNQDAAGAGAILEDKQLMTVDASTTSAFRDRVYVTWTEFTQTTGYIYESFSADYGETFSTKRLVSPAGAQPLCPAPLTTGGGCDNNQFSQPFTAPDGTLYVVWVNANTLTGRSTEHECDEDGCEEAGVAAGAKVNATVVTAIDNHFQVLLAKSTDGGNTFNAPIKVGDYFELPDCPTYQGGQDPGRACVPEKGASMNSVFRASNYPSGGVNPKQPNQLVVSYGSYINSTSNEANGCVPQGFSAFGNPLYDGVKTFGACNNKIVVSVSNNGGASFTGTTADVRTLTTANQANNQRKTDQWFHWQAFTERGKLAITYYDRAYGDDEFNGASDMSISGSDKPNFTEFGVKRVTSSSMPPPTQFPNALGNSQFWGDYIGMTTRAGSALPIWSDSRDPDVFLCPGTAAPGVPPALCTATTPSGIVANDEEIYVDSIEIPTP